MRDEQAEQASAAPAPAARRSVAELSWLLLPPVAALLTRLWLSQRAEADDQPWSAVLEAAPVAASNWDLLWALRWPFGVLLAAAALVLLVRGVGAERFGRGLRRIWRMGGRWAWLVLWAGLVWGMVGRAELDRQPVALLDGPPVRAQVLGVQVQKPSARSVGGARVFMQVQGHAQPQRALLPRPQDATPPRDGVDPATLRVREAIWLVLGRDGQGRTVVTGWTPANLQALPQSPATPAASAASR